MHSPERFVSLISSGTEILFALGLESRVVAVSHECDYPAAALQLPKATRSNIDSRLASQSIDDRVRDLVARGEPLYEIETELLVELAPDLLITQAQCDVCAVRYEDVLSLVRSRTELSGTRVLPLNPRSLEEVLADVERVGDAAGNEAAGRRFADSLRARIAAVAAISAQVPQVSRPRVACLEWLEPLMLAANWTPDIVQLAGGRYGLAQSGRHSQYNDWREVVAYDPEVIIVMPCGFDLPRTLAESVSFANWPGWRGLSAVRRNRVFAVDGNAYFNRSGPRLVDSLEILAHLLHPEINPPPLDPAERSRAWQPL